MRQVPLERDVNIAISGPFWVEAANPEHPFTAMLISHSRGTCLIACEGSMSRSQFVAVWSYSKRITERAGQATWRTSDTSYFLHQAPTRPGARRAGAGGGGSVVASSEVFRNQKVSSGWWEMEKVMPYARLCRGRQNITGELRERRGGRGHRPLLKLKDFRYRRKGVWNELSAS